MTGVLIKGGNLDTDTPREKTEVTLPQAKELPEAEREAGADPPKNLQREHGPAHTSISNC